MALAAVKPLTMQQQESAPPRAVRHRLPGERASITHKFALAGHEGYITVGLYKDGTPGELFIRMAKEGSTVSGLMDSFATAVSLALQHGVPMKLMCEKFSHTRFEPSGFTGNPEIPIAKSIMDYIFRWLELRFVTGRQYPLFKDMVLPPMGAGALSTQRQHSGKPRRRLMLRQRLRRVVSPAAISRLAARLPLSIAVFITRPTR